MFLMAFFTYQVIYSIWMKLDTNEMTALKQGMLFLYHHFFGRE